MRSSKSRSRNKNNNRNRNNNSGGGGGGNVINRVFDSSGPEGKVRGTPQQIIDKYTQLTNDATLSNDRVAAENFQQHGEHYIRMLGEAQREMDAKREVQEREHRERQIARNEQQQKNEQQNPQPAHDPSSMDQPEVTAEPVVEPVSDLVETPEAVEAEKPKRRPRTRKPKAQVLETTDESTTSE